jgi:spore maturation protein SpmA
MLNWIWLGMILIAIVVGGFGGRLETMTNGAFKQAETAVMELALPLIGLYALWLGLMRLAERAGLVQALAHFLRPVMKRLFPDVPEDHPAMGAMVMNMAANMLGLNNSATPLGLRAMAHLQKLNPRKDVASNAMVTFLAINTASIQLIPTTAMVILARQGSQNPSVIVGPALIASIIGMLAAVFLARFLSRWRAFQISGEAGAVAEKEESTPPEDSPADLVEPQPLTGRGKFVLVSFFLLFAAMFYILVCPDAANAALHAGREALPWLFPGDWQFGNFFPPNIGHGQRIIRAISLLAVPFFICFFPLYAALRGVKVYEEFCTGAKESFETAKQIIPFLVAMLVAIRLLRDSGALEAFTESMRPVLSGIGFPPELLPLALLRSLSGSASQGVFVDLASKANHGPDSFIGLTAATMYGSSETTFYVIAVYFGSVGIRKTRHAVLAGLGADLVAVVATVVVCRWMFGG